VRLDLAAVASIVPRGFGIASIAQRRGCAAAACVRGRAQTPSGRARWLVRT